MAMKKVTLTLDDETLAKLERTAARVGRPKSEIVREAINDYTSRVPELTEEEIQRRVKTYEEFLKTAPKRT